MSPMKYSTRLRRTGDVTTGSRPNPDTLHSLPLDYSRSSEGYNLRKNDTVQYEENSSDEDNDRCSLRNSKRTRERDYENGRTSANKQDGCTSVSRNYPTRSSTSQPKYEYTSRSRTVLSGRHVQRNDFVSLQSHRSDHKQNEIAVQRRSGRLSKIINSTDEVVESSDDEENEEEEVVDNVDDNRRDVHDSDEADDGARKNSKRASRTTKLQHIQDDDEVENEEEEEEEDEEEESIHDNGDRKYNLRTSRIPRETMNVKQLGGDGGGYARSSLKLSRQSSNDNIREARSDPVSYKEPKIYLGGRLPSSNSSKKHRNHDHRHHHHHRGSSSRRHFDSSSDSSSGSSSSGRHRRGRRSYGGSSDDSTSFRRHEQHRMEREMDSVRPLDIMNIFHSTKERNHGTISNASMGMGGSVLDKITKRDISRADATPMVIEPGIGFQSVGGLDAHIRALKEMVMFPLLYPEVFHRFDTQPPRGVLFVGPPGTGKTLTARALANSICTGTVGGSERKVSFFMRKGADCLSKWVGEGERQLRLLFEQAKRFQPSIIFFDEIDGLAPVRSSKQDQIHASIVSTLLALMDGLDARGQVVVIGATNRPDAIDPALRRPGRFDRELNFPLPDATARAAILDIHTANWKPSVTTDLKSWIVSNTVGYCGADIKALCSEAALVSLRRAYPQIYDSPHQLVLDAASLELGMGDFAVAFSKVTPASKRVVSSSVGKPLDEFVAPLVEHSFRSILTRIQSLFPAYAEKQGACDVDYFIQRNDEESWLASLTDVNDRSVMNKVITAREAKTGKPLMQLPSGVMDKKTLVTSSLWGASTVTFNPRVLLSGPRGMGHSVLAGATLHALESFQVFSLEFTSLLADSNHSSPEQALVSRIHDAVRVSPSVIYMPDVSAWWSAASECMKASLTSFAERGMETAVLWISTLITEDSTNSTDLSSSHHDMGTDREDALALVSRDSLGSDRSAADDRLDRLLRWLAGSDVFGGASSSAGVPVFQPQMTRGGPPIYPGQIVLTTPTEEERENLLDVFFDDMLLLPTKIYAARCQLLLSKSKSLKLFSQTTNSTNAPAASTKTETPDNSTGISSMRSQLSDVELEREKNYLRELRTFFRAALSELLKQKRLSSFSRPVDPEMVPDYYDIITNPMDLETMRLKVDEEKYPTYKSFLADIQLILNNAKEYNPMTVKDVRGRSIVHSAHFMSDLIETHAYHFQRRLGYNLFSKCEEIYERNTNTVTSASHPASDSGECANAKYYAEVLTKHRSLAEESQTESREGRAISLPQDANNNSSHNSPESQRNDLHTIASARRSLRGREGSSTEVEFVQLDFGRRKRPRPNDAPVVPADSKAVPVAEVSSSAATNASSEGRGDAESLMNRISPDRSTPAAKSSSSSSVSSGNNNNKSPETVEIIAENEGDGDADKEESLALLDQDKLLQKLEVSMTMARKLYDEDAIRKVKENLLKATKGWQISRLTAEITVFNRLLREFRAHGDWKVTWEALESRVTAVSSVTADQISYEY